MSPLFWPLIVSVAVVIAALIFRHALFVGFRRWTGHTSENSLFLQAVRLPSVLWCVVLGLFVAIEMADLPPRLGPQIQRVLEAAIIMSVTITVAGMLGSLVTAASERHAIGLGVTGLARTSVRMTVLIIGTLVLLSSLGIAITPLLTALGVGGLAVALALQDTLSNLFAGMHLLADRPIRVGDYVRLSLENVEGYVVDVGWRSTRIRMLQNNVVIVPNSKVAQSVITNYDLGETRVALPITVGVSYDADPTPTTSSASSSTRRRARWARSRGCSATRRRPHVSSQDSARTRSTSRSCAGSRASRCSSRSSTGFASGCSSGSAPRAWRFRFPPPCACPAARPD